MSSLAIGMVLVAAVAHALWNFAAKRVSAGAEYVWLYYSTSAIFCVPVALWWMLSRHLHPQWTWLLAALVTAILHVGYGLLLQRGYAAADMSVVYPTARGTGPLLAAAIAVTVLGERPATVGLVGVALVVAGVVMIGTGGARGAARRSARAGVGYGLAIGAVIAGYTLWDAHSVTALAIHPVVYFTIAACLQGLFLAPRALVRPAAVLGVIRTYWRETLTVAVLSPLAYLLVLFAMRMAPVALVAPARELSIVFGALLGWLVLREPNPGKRMLGAVVVVAGVVAIGLT